jgi:hypothetical protein
VSFDSLLIHRLTAERPGVATGDAAETPGGLVTALTVDVPAGSLDIELAEPDAVDPGWWLRIGDTGESEIRQVDAVNGSAVTLTAPLSVAHDSGDAVVQVDNAGTPTLDEYGQPLRAWTTFATFRGRLVPKSVREVAQQSGAGPIVSAWTLHCRPRDLAEADRIRLDPDDGRAWEITGIRALSTRGPHHLECDLRLVEAG